MIGDNNLPDHQYAILRMCLMAKEIDCHDSVEEGGDLLPFDIFEPFGHEGGRHE